MMASNNLPFVRFADDFIVLVKTEKAAHRALDFVKKSLARLKLSLNMKKVCVAKCPFALSEAVEVLTWSTTRMKKGPF